MIASKRINLIIIIAVVAAVLFCIVAILLAPKLVEKYGTGVHMGYETQIFDTTQPVEINILMDQDEWQTMLDKATQEVYYDCDVIINGTRFYDVGIRPKGNTSLSSIASNPNTERFSFKLEFDQFVDGQTAWGLDKLCLNNNYADATNMKEALFYDMYKFLGADASLYNYAVIYVNGEYWGIYLALEAVEDSFMLRNYGAQNGKLYKPDQMGLSGGGFGDWGRNDNSNWFTDLIERIFGGDEENDEASGEMNWGSDRSSRSSENSDASEEPESTVVPDPMPPEGNLAESMQQFVDAEESEASDETSDDASGESSEERRWGWGDDDDDGWGWGDDDDGERDGPGGMFGGGGANLNYSGDDLSNYSTIWGSEVTRTDDSDHRRVVQALKNISEGVNLEESMDIDNLLRLMAVHNFSVNGDSLSGSMAHNYYLYESNGQLNILPWDYNLAFGGMGFGGSSGDEVANEPIDDSWGSTNFFDPLLENEEYLAKYHEYYRQLVEEYIFGGGFYEFYNHTRMNIDALVATDPNALYDYDEYDAAAETLFALVIYRGESVLGQLDGTIPSTTQGQRQDSSSLIKAEGVDISVMGSMSMGGSFGGGGGWGEEGDPFRRNRDASDESSDEDASGEESEESASEEQDAEASEETEDSGSAEAVDAATAASVTDDRTDNASGEPDDEASDESDDEASDEPEDEASDEPEDEDGENSSRSRRSESERSGWGSGEMNRTVNRSRIWLLGACAVVLVAGIVFAAWFRKKG